MGEHEAPFNTSPVKEKNPLTFTLNGLFVSSLPFSGEEVKAKKTKNAGRARYACALGLSAGRKGVPDTRR